MTGLAAAFVLAVLVEWLAERFIGPFATGRLMVWLATLVGVAFCILAAVDIWPELGIAWQWGQPWTGEVITGLVVGAGSNAFHDLVGRLKPAA